VSLARIAARFGGYGRGFGARGGSSEHEVVARWFSAWW